MKTLTTTLALTLTFATNALAQTHPMTPTDLWSMGRVSAPALSPDGKTVLYAVTRYDLNTLKSKSELFSVPVAGGAPTLVHSPASAPSWSPDGKQFAYISGGQVYIGDRKVTNLPNGAGGPIVWSRDGTKLLVNSGVTPEGDSLAARFAALAKGKSQARIYDDLGYRHWDEWEDGDRSHVFVVDVASGAARDATPGAFDSPPIALEGFQDYDISPEGREVAYAANKHVPTMVGTGNDIWLTMPGGESKLMVQNEANDNSPVYSPDGKYIAWIAMERPAFEADLARLKLYNRATGQITDLTGKLDLPVGEFKWAADSKSLYFLAQNQLVNDLYKVSLAPAPQITQLTRNQFVSGFGVSADGKTIVVAKQSVAAPVELFVLDAKGNTAQQLTHVNDDLLKQLALQPAEPFWFTGAEGARVEGFIVKPPHFDAARKYPVVFLIHGGPQGAWEDSWSYRWNPNMFASPGYVVVAVNPRGSTGYGQKFTDQISQDWGGRVYVDLMNGLDYALKNNAYMDTARVAAAGASYGGYMINWINGHTDRFKALILHDGMFNTHSAYGSTEEMWFPEWEFGGLPWKNPEIYDKWNPATYAGNMKTPTLVIHGALDYRLSLEQGLMAFTTLRRQGVPSRLLVFPDEGHWVLKPQNAFVWWGEMLGWLNKYIGTKAPTL